MSKIKQVLNEALGVEESVEDILYVADKLEAEGIERLRQLSGLPVSESLGMNEENILNQLLQQTEESITRAGGYLTRYAQKVQQMQDRMSEEEHMHYVYGIQAMIDLVEQMYERVKKLG